MNKDIFVKAKIISKYLQNIQETDKSIYAEFSRTGIQVRIWKENKNLKSSCTCRQFTFNQSDCSHILALKYWLIKNSKPDEIDLLVA